MFKRDDFPKDQPVNPTLLKDENKWGSYGAHDPAIIKDGEWYYVFSTDTGGENNFKAGIQIRKSKDLINWEFVGRAFASGVPEEAFQWTGAKGLWAPEVVKINNKYHLYYAASQFGQTQSFIGLATSDTIEGPYQDQGLVYKSEAGTKGPNAIDPNITFTNEGEIYLVYGSFFGGLYVSEIDPNTGKLMEDGPGTLIARRNETVDRALEGPYIVYNSDYDYYYLFVSYDSLFVDYNIRVARSKSITGPYYDFNDKVMIDVQGDQEKIGMKILGGYRFEASKGWVAPGHNSVLKDEKDFYICHHVRRAEDKKHHFLHIRKILWSDDGWPMVSPQRFAGEDDREVDQKELLGEWEIIEVNPLNRDQDISFIVSVSEGDQKGQPHFEPKPVVNSVRFSLLDMVYEGKVNYGWDWEKWNQTVVFSGHNHKGEVVVGKRRYK